MHLIDNVQSLIDKAVRLAGGQPIKRIRATLGELTGFTPEQVQTQFEQCRVGTSAAGAELSLRLEPGRVVCLSCEQEVPTGADSVACTACGSYRRQVVAGQQLAVEGVSVDRSTSGSRRSARPLPAASPSLARLSAEGDWDDWH
jgi:hydrogenase nickel incorporation protein HypA/HybF